MNGKLKNNKKFISFLIIPLFLIGIFKVQAQISGNVVDINNKNIAFVNVILKAKDEIITYTITDDKGFFMLDVNKEVSFRLVFSSLGFKTKTIDVNLLKKNQKIILTEDVFELKEVIIKANIPISIKKDTITFKTKHFTNGTEETVEDLLKKIPGLNINAEGTIKVGNQEIEKLMIDGDDLFEKGYKILSKNMPAFPVKTVELLKNYSNNRLLKDIEESNKIALNLKLNEEAKRIWFGNLKTGTDLKNNYELLGNLMNFGKKNKYYFLTNLNNIGVDATGDIDHLIRPYRINEPASIGDNQQVSNLIGLSTNSLNFKKSRTNFNNAELLSLNAIFNPTEKLKIKTLSFFNWDENDFFKNSVNTITTSNTSFTNTENFNLQNKKTIGFGKLDFIYNISKTKMLESTTKYNDGNTSGQSNLIFNGASTIQNLQSNNTLFDQKITYSNKFKDKKVFLLTGRFIDEKTPQNYTINQFLYQDLFTSSANTNNVKQLSKNQMQFAGFEAHLLDRKKNGDLLELQFGNIFRKDKLNTSFTLFENSTAIKKPNGFQNTTEYKTNNLYLKTKYRYKIKDFSITGKLNFHQLFNQLKFDISSKEQQPFFINPSIGFDWKINSKNKITSSYSYNTTNALILDVSNKYVLTGFRSFSKGTGDFNQLNASTLLLNYQLGNWSDRFFANTLVFYTKNFDFFSNNTLIHQNFTQSDRIIIKDREFLNISSKFDYYLKRISSNLKVDLGFSKSIYKNVINNSNLRVVKSNNYNYGLELRSGFKGVFNYHIGTKWTTNKIEVSAINNSFTNNVSFLDFSFLFSDNFNIDFQTERYFFGNIDNQNDTYYFLDFDAQYIIKKNKLTFSLSGKNLFNTEKFKEHSINDIGSSTTEYRLLPRYLLLKLEFRF
ncbi:MAG: carboxypeptidase-like regulatory domain-containing protein [Polaribacter sp.]|nr:carboxypeptidase-like regulatory domain-containing protein [Polaribacter sp.]MDG1810677.1 carboxypeptidase-like regulatory domain-containing protein [Polaribacter sp.]MDG1993526.1 carboxypeptidase-like regulatory domain-containing protein [Polaribacter sp.]